VSLGQDIAGKTLGLVGDRLLTALDDDLTDSNDLGRKMMRQVAGAPS
jgi:hypothetical protein